MSEKRFAGQSVLITGAAKGIGRAAAEGFAAEGAKLLLSDLDVEGLEAAATVIRAGGTEVATQAGDSAAPETHEALVARCQELYGRLDVAYNNAGIAHRLAKLPKLSPAEVERVVAVNLLGVLYAMQAQIPVMERQFQESGRGGAIVNIASVAGVVGAGLLSVYTASKHGVVGATKAAAAESAKKGVRINAICPAFIGTDMVAAFIADMGGSPEEAEKRLLAKVPQGRFAELAEIVQAILWAAAPANSFMTGHSLVLDGGLSAV